MVRRRVRRRDSAAFGLQKRIALCWSASAAGPGLAPALSAAFAATVPEDERSGIAAQTKGRKRRGRFCVGLQPGDSCCLAGRARKPGRRCGNHLHIRLRPRQCRPHCRIARIQRAEGRSGAGHKYGWPLASRWLGHHRQADECQRPEPRDNSACGRVMGGSQRNRIDDLA